MNKGPSNHRDPKAQALNRLAHCLTVMRARVEEDTWGPRMEDGVQGAGRKQGHTGGEEGGPGGRSCGGVHTLAAWLACGKPHSPV